MPSQHGIRPPSPTSKARIEPRDASAIEYTFIPDHNPLLGDHSNSIATRLSLGSGQDLVGVYPCRLRGTTSRGLGIFAEESIPVGECIMSERPTLVYDHYCDAMANFGKDCSRSRSEREWDRIEAGLLQEKFEKLSTQQQKGIMLLHNCHEDSGVSALLGTVRTNVFGLSDTLRGVYILCSRFNHDCEPNCTYEFSDMEPHTIRIISIKHIKAGDELTIIYVPHAMEFEERQKTLARKFGFECKCSRCVLEGDKLHTFSYEQQRAQLCFRPRRPQFSTENDQAGDFLTAIASILSAGDLKSIQKDEVILQEKPLMFLTEEELAFKAPAIYRRLLELPKSMRNQYLGLYDWRSKPRNLGSLGVGFLHEGGYIDTGRSADSQCRGLPSHEALLGMWETNSFTLEYGKEAVFSIASHLDHSCQPSCRVVWRPLKETLDLVANRPLGAGDMITICYDYWKIYTLHFEARHKFLKENYGFDCSCIRCYPHLRVGGTLPDMQACVENINHLPLPEIFLHKPILAANLRY